MVRDRYDPLKREPCPSETGSCERSCSKRDQAALHSRPDVISFSGKIAKKRVAIFARRTQETLPRIVDGRGNRGRASALRALPEAQRRFRLVGGPGGSEPMAASIDGFRRRPNAAVSRHSWSSAVLSWVGASIPSLDGQHRLQRGKHLDVVAGAHVRHTKISLFFKRRINPSLHSKIRGIDFSQ